MIHEKNANLAVILTILCAVLAAIPGCSSAASAPDPAKGKTLTQISTTSALNAGLYDGITSCNELNKYGDLGIGTFAGLDGELIEIKAAAI